MGGRGSAGERGSSNGSISSLQKQIEVLGNQMQTLAKYAVHDGRNYNEKKARQYYKIQEQYNQTKQNYYRKLDEKVAAERTSQQSSKARKTFVNSFGEATTRHITSAGYEQQQRRLEKEMIGFVGGETKKKKRRK